jgi:HAMP domain-containing protein
MHTSVKTKIVVAVVAVLAVAAAGAAGVIHFASEMNLRAVATDALHAAGATFAAIERAEIEKLDATLAAIAANPELSDAFSAGDRAGLLARAAPLFERLRRDHDVTHWYFHDLARRCFLRVHGPAAFGDAVDRPTLAHAAATGDRGAGKELGQTAFALRVVRPWVVRGERIGYLELGEEIDHFLARLHAQTGDGYALLVDRRLVDAALWAKARPGGRERPEDAGERVVVERTVDDVSLVRWDGEVAALPARGALLGSVERGGRILARGVVPVTDAAGERVGALVVVHDVTELRTRTVRTRTAVVVTLTACAALLAGILLLVIQRLVFTRLERMIAQMEDLSARLAGGDYDVAAPPAGPPDEIGRFEEFFGRFLTVIAGLLKELTRRRAG